MKGEVCVELHRYDIIEAELTYGIGSVQKKRRPYIIVSNESGTINANIISIMPLTHVIKKLYMPVHGCIDVNSNNGLKKYSMVLGEQPQTICKDEVIRKLGSVTDQSQKNMVNRICYNSFFYGENIDWEVTLNDRERNTCK